MRTTSKIINLLTILIGLCVAVLAYLLLQAADQLRADTAVKQNEVTNVRTALAEAEEKRDREESSLRARKAGLTDDLEDHRKQLAEYKTSLPEKERELESLKKQQEMARQEVNKNRAEVTAKEAEIAQTQQAFQSLRAANPVARGELDQARASIDEQVDLAKSMELELKNYKIETEHLRAHYASILTALEADALNPSWITIGKSVSTRIEQLSMETGMLVLPLGTSHGLRNNMRFFVAKKGRRVGQLVVKDAGLAHSVAIIVPMIGTPGKLREKDEVEITGF
ncbi:MAG: hypothetical protein VCA36_03005 [Opitutales bacterium]